MNNHYCPILTAALVIATLSMLLMAPAYAVAWVGNDDGEFDTNCYGCSGWPSHVEAYETLSSPMSWATGPGQTQNNWMSFQYNPDWDTSKLQQHESCCAVTDDWFQTAIIDQKPTVSDPNCVLLTIQVYDTSLDSVDNAANLDGRADFPSASSCYTVSDILSAGSTWYIDELVDSGQDRIIEVLYGVSPGTGGTGLQYSLFPPYADYWFWLRSNICWCGVSGYADPYFTSAYGTNALHSDKNLWSIDPPIDLATAENSNMPYTQFTGAGTTSMSQMFGWAPTGGGGGGGGGGCVRHIPTPWICIPYCVC